MAEKNWKGRYDFDSHSQGSQKKLHLRKATSQATNKFTKTDPSISLAPAKWKAIPASKILIEIRSIFNRAYRKLRSSLWASQSMCGSEFRTCAWLILAYMCSLLLFRPSPLEILKKKPILCSSYTKTFCRRREDRQPQRHSFLLGRGLSVGLSGDRAASSWRLDVAVCQKHKSSQARNIACPVILISRTKWLQAAVQGLHQQLQPGSTMRMGMHTRMLLHSILQCLHSMCLLLVKPCSRTQG